MKPRSISALTRREFCLNAAAAALPLPAAGQRQSDTYAMIAAVDKAPILTAGQRALSIQPVTITAFRSPRSPGGAHDFFSQADYFWPNPANPDGPYINRDGQSNPDNFNDHRKAMIALSLQMPALTAAWRLTGDRRYSRHAADHLRAWFVAPETRMNPNLEYAQGVHGVSTGRNFGIIDTLHLVEVARAASFIAPLELTATEQAALNGWFADYLHWMQTSAKGIAERDTKNNHAVCWALQAAEFARLINDEATRKEIAKRYREVFVPDQMGPDGSFPLELKRTKPYSYSIFNFDVLAGLCQSLLSAGDDLFAFRLPDGRGACKAAAFLFPYLLDKNTWPYAKDVEHFDALPVRSPGLLFCGAACGQPQYIALWKKLNPDPTDPEIIRNYPIRQPLLWYPKSSV
jgi:hypothetical protein